MFMIALSFPGVSAAHAVGSTCSLGRSLCDPDAFVPSVALFFYDIFFGHASLGVLNILSIYIILGIGVDDCYVFLDAFQQVRRNRL